MNPLEKELLLKEIREDLGDYIKPVPGTDPNTFRVHYSKFFDGSPITTGTVITTNTLLYTATEYRITNDGRLTVGYDTTL